MKVYRFESRFGSSCRLFGPRVISWPGNGPYSTFFVENQANVMAKRGLFNVQETTNESGESYEIHDKSSDFYIELLQRTKCVPMRHELEKRWQFYLIELSFNELSNRSSQVIIVISVTNTLFRVSVLFQFCKSVLDLFCAIGSSKNIILERIFFYEITSSNETLIDWSLILIGYLCSWIIVIILI